IKQMERYLCLDIGDKRIGIAVSDPFNTYALPVETYNRISLKKDLMAIEKYVKEKGATALVCGLPVNFDGTPSIQTAKAQFFIDKLKESLGMEIYTIDERCTTCEAEEVLIESGYDRKERKQFVDSIAASTILESFLNEKNKQ
ncbi:MAG: Holliday junction resolvase RuvX, partial [Firmicutes bacterium]|nr:Holliday junction resolvase RuvX [Candidatus Caballimonas caccae]